MSPNIWLPTSFFARHLASGKVRRVTAVRRFEDGSRVYQFAQVIKHEGATLYGADSSECLS